MARGASQKAVALKTVNGRVVSGRSKTGNPQCSAAMSAWVRSRHGGPAVTAEIYKILGKCRSQARQNKKAEQQQASGKLAQGRGTWQRSEKAAELVAQRREKQMSREESAARLREVEQRLMVQERGTAPGQPASRPRKVNLEARAKAAETRAELARSAPQWAKAEDRAARKAKAAARAAAKAQETPAGGISKERLAKARETLKAGVPDEIRGKVLAAMQRVERQAAQGAPVTARELRAELADVLPRKSQFDRVIRGLRADGTLNLHRHDSPMVEKRLSGVSAEDRAKMVRNNRADASEFGASRNRLARVSYYNAVSAAPGKLQPADSQPADSQPVSAPRRPSKARSQAADDARERAWRMRKILSSGGGKASGEAFGSLQRPAPIPAAQQANAANKAPSKPKAGPVGSAVLRSKAIDRATLDRLSERPTTIEGEDFARRKDLAGQGSFLGKTAEDRSGTKAPGRGALDRQNLARRIRETLASDGRRTAAARFEAERLQARAEHNAGLYHRKLAERQQAERAAAPSGPAPKQGSLFGGGSSKAESQRPDLRVKGEETPSKPPNRAEWRAMVEASRGDRAARRQRRAERLKGQRAELADARTSTVRDLPTDRIEFDPQRFQYKLDSHSSTGSVGSLSGVKKWDPELGGVLQVWKDPSNGKTYVVNGHNRLDLAKRLGAGKVSVRYIKAKDAQEARAKGAITNIAEGRGNATDAAQFFRDTGLTREDLESRGVPMRERIATQGLALAGLEDKVWRRVKAGEMPVERAAILGGSGLDHAQQRAVLDLADKVPKSRPLSNSKFQELVDNARAASKVKTTTRDLFGVSEEDQSLALRRVDVQDFIKEKLGREKRVFGTVSKSRNAEDLTRAGNQINAEESGKVSQAAAENLATFHAVKGVRGPVSDLLNESAERIHRGEKPRQVYEDTYKRLPAAIQTMLRGG